MFVGTLENDAFSFYGYRLCLAETSCPQEDNYPNSLCIKVNGKLFPLPVSMYVCICGLLVTCGVCMCFSVVLACQNSQAVCYHSDFSNVRYGVCTFAV